MAKIFIVGDLIKPDFPCPAWPTQLPPSKVHINPYVMQIIILNHDELPLRK